MGTLAVLAAMALVVLDAGITNVALPTISAALDVAPAKAVWVASAYQLAVLIGLFPAAHIAGRIGGRKLFICGTALFTMASLLAASASGLVLLVAARFMQGIGGAAILALGIPLLRLALGQERLGSAIAWNALNVALCAAAGPAIGAVILTVADWPWLFLVNLPVGLLAIAASFRLPTTKGHGDRIDWSSIALHAGAAAMMFMALESLAKRMALALALATGSAASFAFLLQRERSKPAPLVPLDLLASRPFRLAAAASACCFVAQCGGQLALPFLLQHSLALNALAMGLVVACWPLGAALSSALANALASRTSAWVLCALGACLIAVGLLVMGALELGTLPIAACASLCGIGFGLFQVPNNRTLFFAAPERRSEAAGAMQATARLSGQTTGGVVVSLIFAGTASNAAPRLALAVAAAFALGSAILSLLRVEQRAQGVVPCET
jgi:DHA2 family multidrug resistance protein-like MFS transporter